MNNTVNEQDEPDIIGDEEYPQPKEIDEDALYEQWRDDETGDLYHELKVLIKRFTDRKGMYFSNDTQKALEHAVFYLNVELTELIEAKKVLK